MDKHFLFFPNKWSNNKRYWMSPIIINRRTLRKFKILDLSDINQVFTFFEKKNAAQKYKLNKTNSKKKKLRPGKLYIFQTQIFQEICFLRNIETHIFLSKFKAFLRKNIKACLSPTFVSLKYIRVMMLCFYILDF